MKKSIFVLLVAAFCFMQFSTDAFAVRSSDKPYGFEKQFELFMTGGKGDTTPKTNFGWNETPWLYVSLPAAGMNITSVWWQNPNTQEYYTSAGPDNQQERWMTLEGWHDIKTAGRWDVSAVYHYSKNPKAPFGGGETSFNVNAVSPEPVSSALFLLGGATLFGIRKLRKK